MVPLVFEIAACFTPSRTNLAAACVRSGMQWVLTHVLHEGNRDVYLARDGWLFPHAEIDGLESPALAFARSKTSLDFDAPDGERVSLIFLLLTPPREYDRELQILSAMARLLTREEVRRGLLEARTPEEVLDTIDQADRPPPSVVVLSAKRAARGV